MEVFPGAADELARLEAAASFILASPSEVSNEARKEAENLFTTLRENRLSPQICRYILETSKSDFVLFEVAQLIGLTLLKEWSTTDRLVVEETFNFLLKYAADRPSLANFVRAEILHSCARLFKRGIFDQKTGDPEMLYSLVARLLSDEDQRMQTYGCELIDAIATEFSSSWRGANFGITWDFHLRAKKAFEATGLRQLFQLSLRTLGLVANGANLSSAYYLGLCDKFLRLAESVLSWNFSSRLYPPRLIYCTEINASAALRPPNSWSHIFQNDDLLNLFFQLHATIRHHEHLCERSMNILVQLSSLTGDVLEKTDVHLERNPSDHYLTLYIKNFLNVFKNGPLEHEINGFCLVFYKLFTFQKLVTVTRVERDVLSNFLLFIVQYSEHFAPIAMERALVNDDHQFREGLVQVYEAWSVLVRAASRNQFSIPLHDFTFRILSAFVRNIFSSPIGNRVELSDANCSDEDEQDDRTLFSDILVLTGQFAVFCIDQFLPMVISVFEQKLHEFNQFLSGSASESSVSNWREDMHWLFLLIGFSFVEEDIDGLCHLPDRVNDYCSNAAKDGTTDPCNSMPYIRSCIQDPHHIAKIPKLCPFMQMTGLVFAWNSLEHSLLSEKGIDAVSPELSRSTLWCTNRLVASLSVNADPEEEDAKYLPVLEQKSDFSRLLIEFALHRTFIILNRMPGEKKLCTDAVNLLVGLVDSRAAELASNDLLYTCLAGIQLDSLPARRALIRALVLIGASANDESLQEKMCVMILKPLAERFDLMCADRSARESDIGDLFDCFCGVASSAELHSAHVLFRFLSPILSRSIALFTSRKDSQFLVDAILELFAVVTRKLAVYIDDKDDTISLYSTLLELLKAYQRDQLSKYRITVIDEEEKATDLALILDILANIMSKDLLLSAVYSDEDAFDYGSRAAFMGLEMLIPLMEEQLLKFPTLCTRFYRLILYFSEMAPNRIGQMPQPMFLSILQLLRAGLQSQFGQEVAAISVETVNHIATYFAQQRNADQNVVAQLSTLIEGTFTMCLEASCQLDVFSEAAFALHALICCNRAAFNDFVNYVLSHEQNVASRNQLEASFSALLPAEHTSAARRQKREFRDRLEKFLNNTQGLLVVN